MHRDPSATIAAILAPIDRRSVADRLLAFLVQDSGASGGAVFSLAHDGLVPFVVRGLAMPRLMEASDLWTHGREVLSSGGTILSAERALTPILCGELLQGLLYLTTPRAFDPRASSAFIGAIGRALDTSASGLQGEAPINLQPGGKEELLSALHRSEWNLARAARMISCSRRTIYLRMQRYGIDRKRVPKSVHRPAR